MVKPSVENSTVVSARLPNALSASLDRQLGFMGLTRQKAIELAAHILAGTPETQLQTALAHIAAHNPAAKQILASYLAGRPVALIPATAPAKPAAQRPSAPAKPADPEPPGYEGHVDWKRRQARAAYDAKSVVGADGLTGHERERAEKISDPKQRARFVENAKSVRKRSGR